MKKKVFICSTSFDLKDTRAEIRNALLNWGYEPILFESPDFPVQKGLHSHDVCLDAVKECDLFLLIIGSRYGGIYHGNKYPKMNELSITRAESRIALDEGLEFKTFIRDDIWNERATYKHNLKLGNKIDSFHAEGPNVFNFIDEIIQRVNDNWIYQFEDSVELKDDLEKMLFPKSIVGPLIESEDEDIKIDFILSQENKEKILLHNGKEMPYLSSKTSRGPAMCIIYADVNNQFLKKSYFLEVSIISINIDDLKKIMNYYYSTFKEYHYTSAFGINQETCSWFGYGPLNFIKTLEMQNSRYMPLRQNNDYIHHREAACFIDECSDSIFYIHLQPNKKHIEDEILTLDYVNIGFLFNNIPCCNAYNKFFKMVGLIPNVVLETNNPLTIFKEFDHTVEKEDVIITNPDTQYGGWVCGIYSNTIDNDNPNNRTIVNFGQHHEQEDKCKYKILSLEATTLPPSNFPAVILNYRGNWEIKDS